MVHECTKMGQGVTWYVNHDRTILAVNSCKLYKALGSSTSQVPTHPIHIYASPLDKQDDQTARRFNR